MNYEWAQNPLKLQRAITKAGSNDEIKIKEEYIKLGGKLHQEPIKKDVSELGSSDNADDSVTEEVEVTPRKRGAAKNAK